MKPVAPAAQCSLLIRRPVGEVFTSFIQPDALTRFWLAAASGPLVVGQTVRWDFMVPGASVETTATRIERDQHIAVAWSDGSTVDWRFSVPKDGTTRVEVENAGFSGTPEETMAQALEATQGFTVVLCDLKVLLESGQSAHLVRDKAEMIAAKSAGAGRDAPPS